MNKNILAGFLAMTLVVSLAGCASAGSTAASSAVANNTQGAASSAQGVEVDEKLLSVEVTLPASMFESDSESAQTPQQFCDSMTGEDGIKNATVNADGSVTLTMTKSKYNAMLDDMTASIDESIASYTDGATYPSVKKIEHNADMTEFTVTVDRAAYESSFDGFVTWGLGMAGAYYRVFAGDSDYHIAINVVDETNGETISATTFPDDYNANSSSSSMATNY